LAPNLWQLQNLREFPLSFGIFSKSQVKSLEWMVDIMNTLTELDRFRKIKIYMAFPEYLSEYLLPIEQKIVNAVLELKNIREIEFGGGPVSSLNFLKKSNKICK